MTLYYTPNLRPNDAVILMVGQIHLEIPPGSKRYSASSVCDAEDTQKIFAGPINIVRGLNHMHYLGREQYIELFRNGEKVQSITNESTYSYDRPTFHPLPEPMKVHPGDEIKTTCVFKTTNKKKTTFMGRGTNEEMCFGFLEVYPAKNLRSRACVNWRSLSMAKLSRENPYGCNLDVFFNYTEPHFIKVKENCRPLSKCLEECKEVVKEIREHPCMKGDMQEYTKAKARDEYQWYSYDALNFMSRIQSCDLEFLKDDQQLVIQKMVSDKASSGTKLQMKLLNLISSFLFAAFMFMNLF
ncbi:uncharacterized protein LOC134269632 [Saccostrea cucullata]|uniref:uncharacterized protein LOC134269632 n=1 Tax=Saccostrea cuccullata TaxID=36930 RepID=UPI002ED3CE35